MKYKYVSSVTIIIIVIFIGSMSIITPDTEVSILEGRTLEILPLPEFIRNILNNNRGNDIKESYETKVNADKNGVINKGNISDLGEPLEEVQVENSIKVYIRGILNGDYFKRWDSYLSDHIFLRDNMVSSYMDIQKLKNSKYINGVFIGKDNMLFSTSSLNYDDKYIKERANVFNDFVDKINTRNIFLGIIPNKYMIEKECFPIENNDISQEIVVDKFKSYIDNDKINLINFKELQDTSNIFYKTDHHLNSEGAYLAYKGIVESLNTIVNIGDVLAKDEFLISKFENCYIGSDGRKIGYLVEDLDDLIIYEPKNINYTAFDNNLEYNLIDKTQISEERFNNDYLVFMGGDKSRVVINNKDSLNDLSILIVGDSIDNPLVPMLVPHFNTIYSFDLRYNNIDIINEINDINPDIVMLLGLPFGYLDNSSKVFRIS